ncbi:unnamed protein product, partial [Polarella glacialis]
VSEEEEKDAASHWGSQFVIKEGNPYRQVWTVTVTFLLLYVGTWFLFQLSFIDLHRPDPLDTPTYLGVDPILWQTWTAVVDGLFWIDLVANFFFSYVDANGREVDNLK